MDMKKIEDFLREYQAGVSFVIIIGILLFVLTQNAYLATHLDECRIQNEAYKQNPPRIEPGKGGFDNWESSIIADE